MPSWKRTLRALVATPLRAVVLTYAAISLARWLRREAVATERRAAASEARRNGRRLERRRRKREAADASKTKAARRRAREEKRRAEPLGFKLTEKGEVRGSLGSSTTGGFGWYVTTAPLHAFDATRSPEKKAPRKKAVRFSLDATKEFYGFVFRVSDGVCVAHGTSPDFVGLTLGEVLARTRNDAVTGDELHRRFVDAAYGTDEGGGFVEYAWRNDADAPLKSKGAYVVKLRSRPASRGDDFRELSTDVKVVTDAFRRSQQNTPLYAGVGYAVVPPSHARRPSVAAPDGLYGFVVTGEGRVVAHGGSPEFVGLTLSEVLQRAHNTRIDGDQLSELIERAGAAGGGWISYPWRNRESDVLAQKGCFVVRLERERGRPDSPASLTKSHTVLYAGVGFFPGGGAGEPADDGDRPSTPPLPTPPPVPPSPDAARAALHALVRRVDAGDDLGRAVADGSLGAAAAEAICWSRTSLPEDLLATLRNHAVSHLADHC